MIKNNEPIISKIPGSEISVWGIIGSRGQGVPNAAAIPEVVNIIKLTIKIYFFISPLRSKISLICLFISAIVMPSKK
jgi:hypothetical protein